MTTTGIVYQTLSKYNELTAGAIHKKCAGMPGIASLKSVSNALTRLKKGGRVESVYDEDKGLWLWHIVRESPVASSDCAMRIGDAAAKKPASDTREPFRPDKIVVPVNPETGKLVLDDVSCAPGHGDHFSRAEEMASDITEINHESIVETREPDAHANADDASQIAASDAVQVSDQAEAETGWAPETAADTSNVLGIPVQIGHEAKAFKSATMPVSIALSEFCSYSWKEGISLAEVFMSGIAYAEEYHKIGPNENGDYL